MTDRDTFAAAALPLCTRNGRNAEQISESAYKLADAMLRERERTNHDAVPEAIARTESASCGRGCGGTDKPVTLPAMGTGDLSEAEIDALEYVVEEGRIASMDDYGILRSLLVRVRPEWEAADSVSPFAKPETDSPQPDATPQTHATPGECSVPQTYAKGDEKRVVCGTKQEPVAWAILHLEYQFVSLLREVAEARNVFDAPLVPLYRSPTLTDEEREAVRFFADIHSDDEPPHEYAATLRKLLERLHT
jgi:hypothetical protein